MSLHHRPAALLLDFGGVIFELRRCAEGPGVVATRIQQLLQGAGHSYPLEELLASFVAGQTALKLWKHAASRRPAPRELTHREIMGDFYAADLGHAARRRLMDDSSELLEFIALALWERVVRPGIPELLELCGRENVRLAVVSNAHSGRAHRRLLEDNGLADYFEAQVYSDEVGIRKPNPRMIGIAAEALGVDPADVWFVGDSRDRDLTAGRRAGVGAVILTRSRRTDNPPFPVAHRPDAVVDDPRGVLDFMRGAIRDGAR